MNTELERQTQQVNYAAKPSSKIGSSEYWNILSNIASGKEKVYSHETVMAELRKVLKR